MDQSVDTRTVNTEASRPSKPVRGKLDYDNDSNCDDNDIGNSDENDYDDHNVDDGDDDDNDNLVNEQCMEEIGR